MRAQAVSDMVSVGRMRLVSDVRSAGSALYRELVEILLKDNLALGVAMPNYSSAFSVPFTTYSGVHAVVAGMTHELPVLMVCGFPYVAMMS